MAKHSRNAPHHRRRSDDSFRRRTAYRPTRPILLIVCEGAETEPRYFNAWRTRSSMTTVTIEVVGGAGQARTVIATAIDKRNARRSAYQRASRHGQSADPPFEEVWCVFDREGQYEVEGFWNAVARADQESIQLAISNPCFEYWYLLHFRDTGAFFHSGRELQQELRQHVANYAKNMDLFDQLYAQTNRAVERARRQYEQHPDRIQDRFPNPSTTVYQLVERLYASRIEESG